jgi:DNA primase
MLRLDNVVALFKRLGSTKFKRIKNNRLVVQCPFGNKHSDGVDSHPSCLVSLVDGFYYCFACKSMGKIQDLLNIKEDELMRVSLDSVFIEALMLLEGKDLNEDVLCEFDFDNIHYALSRGIREDICKLFEVGFDKVNNRVIFVVRDQNGRLVGIQGRDVTNSDRAKYYDYVAFEQCKIRDYLYRLDLCKILDSVILVEGVFDVMNLYQHGYRNVLGVFGSKVTSKQIELLKQLNVSKVYIFFDNDKAGDDGYLAFSKVWRGKVERIKADKDPSDLSREELENVLRGLDFVLC